MSINRITRQRLYQDEELFNSLLQYAKYDEEYQVFVNADAAIWSVWELSPRWLYTISDEEAFQICGNLQEMVDSFDHNFSLQFIWVSTYDVEAILKKSLREYPTSKVAGWMARRWIKSLRTAARNASVYSRPRHQRLFIAFRFDPPWRAVGLKEQTIRTIELLLKGKVGVSAELRKQEYKQYANQFRGIIDGNISKLFDLRLNPRLVDGQALIDLLYPILNRRSTKGSKIRHNRRTAVPVPEYDPNDYLSNQVSETPAYHIDDGILKKDGRYFRTASMVKPPKQCLPLMITPFQSTPYENILAVTFSKDSHEDQLNRLNQLDSFMGLRLRTFRGRANQKVQTQIGAIRAARQELYSNVSQIVRVGVHQTFICEDPDEAIRASAEAVASFPQLNGARGMTHLISDIGVLLNTLPACYDPSTDGPGWTTTMRSSRAVRFFPIWGNWTGSKNKLFVLPCLWNRELVGFDLYDSNMAPNVLISGVSGAGKSYLLCYLIITLMRGHFSQKPDGSKQEKPPIAFIFDKGMTGQPCGFERLAHIFGGKVYEATPSKAPAMNFLARLGDTSPTGSDDYKDLIDMSVDIILDMASDANTLTDRLDRSAVRDSVIEAHRIYYNGARKREFLLSDVVSVLRAPKRVDENEQEALRRQRVSVLISDYYGDGTYANFFDKPGSLKLDQRMIVFDLKALSRNPDLQRVFLKVAMLWADTVMNTPEEIDTRKLLVFDEAHDLIGKTSAATIETAFRLYRKRKGMVIAASQSGEDFYVGEGGQAIVQNSAHKIFLKQDPSKFHLTAQAFNLSSQQSRVITSLQTIMGVESQFYLLSDIGEAPLVLPLESAFYWVSTNNGDDNQLYSDLVKQYNGDYMQAFLKAVEIAPYGAKAFHSSVKKQKLGINASNEEEML